MHLKRHHQYPLQRSIQSSAAAIFPVLSCHIEEASLTHHVSIDYSFIYLVSKMNLLLFFLGAHFYLLIKLYLSSCFCLCCRSTCCSNAQLVSHCRWAPRPLPRSRYSTSLASPNPDLSSELLSRVKAAKKNHLSAY